MLRIVFALLFIFVSYLLLFPSEELPKVEVSDKLAHVLVFFSLMFTGGLAFGRKNYLRTGILLIMYGALVEIVQPYVNRNASLYDALANFSGVIIAIVLIYFVDQMIWRILNFLKISR
ncbi:MAG: VanZ family protein [Bacteroidota bacterium]